MNAKRSKAPPARPDPTTPPAPTPVDPAARAAARANKLDRLVAAANRVQRAKQELLFAETELLGLAGEDVVLAAIMSVAWHHPDGSKIEVSAKEEPGEGRFEIPVPK